MHFMKTITACGLAPFFGIISTVIAQTATQAKSGDYAGEGTRIVHQLAGGRYDTVVARFDAWMAREMPVEKLSTLWGELLAQAGPFKAVTAVSVTPELGGYYVVAMTCCFQRVSENNALVTFDRDGRIAGLYFGPQPTELVNQWGAPSYADLASFREERVVVPDGPWRLPGTLTLPRAKRQFPAVVLVPGSPPLDQDGTAGPNKIFKDLAWGLGSRGIAVLRYTKRTHQFGTGLGGGQLSSFTPQEELEDDARAAVALLANRNDIDHRRIYLIGHSMGGEVAPRIATNDPRIAGIVVMGAASGNMLAVLLKRIEDVASLGGPTSEEASKTAAVIRRLQNAEIVPGKIVELFGERSPVGYWMELRNYGAGSAIVGLKIPIMVMVAGHDAEVPPNDFEGWKSALAGHVNATLKFYPGQFHLFMPSTATRKGDTAEDWERPAHVTSEVVGDITSWVFSRERK